MSFLAMGWNDVLAFVQLLNAIFLSTWETNRNTGLQNFIRPFTTPEPSSPMTHLAASTAISFDADEDEFAKATP